MLTCYIYWFSAIVLNLSHGEYIQNVLMHDHGWYTSISHFRLVIIKMIIFIIVIIAVGVIIAVVISVIILIIQNLILTVKGRSWGILICGFMF